MEIKDHLLSLQFWISMVSFSPFPSTFSPCLQSYCGRRGRKKIICSVQGDSFDLHCLAFLSLSLSAFFFFFKLSKRLFLTLEGVMLLTSWEISVSFPFSQNRLLQIPLLLRFYLASKHLMTMLFHT